MKFPQSKKFLGWYLKEKEKHPVSPVILAIQEKYNLRALTEARISELQLATMGMITFKLNLYKRTEDCFRELNEIYDAQHEEDNPPT